MMHNQEIKQTGKGKILNKKEDEGEKKQKLKMIFWNVAGLINKDEDFWKYLRDFNVISLTETLLKERGEEKLRDKLPQDYKQSCQAAVRDKFKGRGMGGMIVRIRREIREKKIEQKRET